MAFEISSEKRQKNLYFIMEIPEVSFRVQFDAVNGFKGKYIHTVW